MLVHSSLAVAQQMFALAERDIVAVAVECVVASAVVYAAVVVAVDVAAGLAVSEPEVVGVLEDVDALEQPSVTSAACSLGRLGEFATPALPSVLVSRMCESLDPLD